MSNPAVTAQIVIDESVDAAITEALRIHGFVVISIAEDQSSISDNEVLEVANKHAALLVTEDKDFGELVVRLKKPHHGILLIRLAGFPSHEKATVAVNAISNHFKELKNAFSVLDHNKLRIRILE